VTSNSWLDFGGDLDYDANTGIVKETFYNLGRERSAVSQCT